MGSLIVQHAIALIALAIGSAMDMRKREVYDAVSMSMIALGLIAAAVVSVQALDYWPFLNSLIGYGAAYLVGMAFYLTRQWGGGDAKVLMGIGAILGIDVIGIFSRNAVPDFGIFLLDAMLAGIVYGFVMMLVMAFRNRHAFLSELHRERHSDKKLVLRKIVLGIVILVVILTFVLRLDLTLTILIYLWLLLVVFLHYASIFMKAVEKSCMVKTIPVSSLTEGDWIVDYAGGRKPKFEVAGTGVTLEQILKLKKSGVRRVNVKEGIPFVPSFLLGYVLLLVFGNWIMIFL